VKIGDVFRVPFVQEALKKRFGPKVVFEGA